MQPLIHNIEQFYFCSKGRAVLLKKVRQFYLKGKAILNKAIFFKNKAILFKRYGNFVQKVRQFCSKGKAILFKK